MDATVLGNFDVIEQSVTPGFSTTGKWYEFFTGDSLTVDNINAPLNFKPGEYRLYTTKRLGKPFFSAIDDHSTGASAVSVYPNPSGGKFTFSLVSNRREDAKIMIYNIFGEPTGIEKTFVLATGLNEFSIDLSEKSATGSVPGIYLFRMETGTQQWIGKLIVR
jgi:hypothetical protein